MDIPPKVEPSETDELRAELSRTRESLDTMIVSINNLIETVKTLTPKVETLERRDKRKTRVLYALAVLVLVGSVFGVVTRLDQVRVQRSVCHGIRTSSDGTKGLLETIESGARNGYQRSLVGGNPATQALAKQGLDATTAFVVSAEASLPYPNCSNITFW